MKMNVILVKYFGFGFGYLVGRTPKLGHHTDGLWCVNNLPKVVT